MHCEVDVFKCILTNEKVTIEAICLCSQNYMWSSQHLKPLCLAPNFLLIPQFNTVFRFFQIHTVTLTLSLDNYVVGFVRAGTMDVLLTDVFPVPSAVSVVHSECSVNAC